MVRAMQPLPSPPSKLGWPPQLRALCSLKTVGTAAQLAAALFWVSLGLPACSTEAKPGPGGHDRQDQRDLTVLLDEATKAVPGMLALSGVFISLK